MPPLIRYSNISNILISVSNSNFIFVFLSMLTMLILVQIENMQDQVDILLHILFKNFQIHQQVMMYLIEHIDHEILQSFLF